MIKRTSITSPTSMYTSEYYNNKKYCGSTGYFNGRYKNGYQCVNYAVSRSCEIAQRPCCYYSGTSEKKDIEKPMFNRYGYGNAVEWLNDTLWEKGTTPKVGAIMVYGKAYGNGYGHVRVIEDIVDGKIVYSGANESNAMAFKTLSIPSITTTGFLGYIYNPYVDTTDSSLIKIEKDSNYDYKWSVDGNKYGDTYDITTQGGFDDTSLTQDGWERVLKVNASLFYTYENKHYACGLEKSRGINNQELDMSCVTDYNSCMAVACVDNELYFASQEYIIKNLLDKAYGAVTGLGLIFNGYARDDLHSGFDSQWNCISGRTVIGEDKDGNILSYSFAGETGSSGVTAKQVQAKCLELGFYNAIMFDGGGSVFREYNGKYDISTSRKVKNALILYRKKKSGVEPTPDTPSDDYKEKYEKLLVRYESLNTDYQALETDYKNELAQVDTLTKENSTLNEKAKALESDNEVLSEKLKKIKEIVG